MYIVPVFSTKAIRSVASSVVKIMSVIDATSANALTTELYSDIYHQISPNSLETKCPSHDNINQLS